MHARTTSTVSILLAVALLSGCGGGAIHDPLVATTEGAMPSDGYQAAVSAAEAAHYQIVVRDPGNALIRVLAKSPGASGARHAVEFELQAWSGQVEIRTLTPPGLALDEHHVQQLSRERQDLAWSVAQRARILSGNAIPTPEYRRGLTPQPPPLVQGPPLSVRR